MECFIGWREGPVRKLKLHSLILFLPKVFLLTTSRNLHQNIQWLGSQHPEICITTSRDLYHNIHGSVSQHSMTCTTTSNDMHHNIQGSASQHPMTCTTTSNDMHHNFQWAALFDRIFTAQLKEDAGTVSIKFAHLSRIAYKFIFSFLIGVSLLNECLVDPTVCA